MSKQQYIEAQRVKPLGIDGLMAIRAILAGQTAQKVHEVFIDTFTASAIVAVHDALREDNRAKMLSLPVARVADISFKLIKKAGV